MRPIETFLVPFFARLALLCVNDVEVEQSLVYSVMVDSLTLDLVLLCCHQEVSQKHH